MVEGIILAVRLLFQKNTVNHIFFESFKTKDPMTILVFEHSFYMYMYLFQSNCSCTILITYVFLEAHLYLGDFLYNFCFDDYCDKLSTICDFNMIQS